MDNKVIILQDMKSIKLYYLIQVNYQHKTNLIEKVNIHIA